MIIFESVTKKFGEDSVALEDVSFEIGDGELVVITGHSGSGKTTLMRLLTKEYLPTQGEIYFNDTPLSKIKASKVHHHRRQLGIIFQDYKLLPELNVWENIALALNIMGKSQDEVEMRVTDLLRLVDLVDKAFLFPSQLSGGEAQRVSIARALATGPSVIFADEPTGNLDPETSVSIAKLLQKIHSLGTTVIIATHDLSVMDVLTNERHLKLEKGKLVKDTGAKTTKHPHSAKHSEHPPEKTVDHTEEVPAKSADHHQNKSDQPEKSARPEAEKKPHEAERKPKETKSDSTKPHKPKFGLPKFKLPFGKKAEPKPKPETNSESAQPPAETDTKHHHSEPESHHSAPAQTEPKPSDKVEVKVESLD